MEEGRLLSKPFTPEHLTAFVARMLAGEGVLRN